MNDRLDDWEWELLRAGVLGFVVGFVVSMIVNSLW